MSKPEQGNLLDALKCTPVDLLSLPHPAKGYDEKDWPSWAIPLRPWDMTLPNDTALREVAWAAKKKPGEVVWRYRRFHLLYKGQDFGLTGCMFGYCSHDHSQRVVVFGNSKVAGHKVVSSVPVGYPASWEKEKKGMPEFKTEMGEQHVAMIVSVEQYLEIVAASIAAKCSVYHGFLVGA